MHYGLRISPFWKPIFSLFGCTKETCYAELDPDGLLIRFGSVHERLPLAEIVGVVPGAGWPFFFGLGAKIGPRGGVSYVGSTKGIVELHLRHPRAMNVWGPFNKSNSRCVTLSVEDAEGFMDAVRRSLPVRSEG